MSHWARRFVNDPAEFHSIFRFIDGLLLAAHMILQALLDP